MEEGEGESSPDVGEGPAAAPPASAMRKCRFCAGLVAETDLPRHQVRCVLAARVWMDVRGSTVTTRATFIAARSCDWRQVRCQYCNMPIIRRDIGRHETKCRERQAAKKKGGAGAAPQPGGKLGLSGSVRTPRGSSRNRSFSDRSLNDSDAGVDRSTAANDEDGSDGSADGAGDGGSGGMVAGARTAPVTGSPDNVPSMHDPRQAQTTGGLQALTFGSSSEFGTMSGSMQEVGMVDGGDLPSGTPATGRLAPIPASSAGSR